MVDGYVAVVEWWLVEWNLSTLRKTFPSVTLSWYSSHGGDKVDIKMPHLFYGYTLYKYKSYVLHNFEARLNQHKCVRPGGLWLRNACVLDAVWDTVWRNLSHFLLWYGICGIWMICVGICMRTHKRTTVYVHTWMEL